MRLTLAVNTWSSDGTQSSEDQVFIAIDKTKCTKESECKTEAAEGFSGSQMWVL